jgi:hypothetical protein
MYTVFIRGRGGGGRFEPERKGEGLEDDSLLLCLYIN